MDKNKLTVVFVGPDDEKQENGIDIVAENGSGIYMSQIQNVVEKKNLSYTIRWNHENENWDEIDFIVFVDFFKRPMKLFALYMEVYRAKCIHKTVYLMQEPESVVPFHADCCFILSYFSYILTYNESIVDNDRIFKLPICYNFYNNFQDYNYDWTAKKLLTNISGYHRSESDKELYKERERVISFFDKNYPNDFEFFGRKWPAEMFQSYRGLTDNKCKTYQGYKFAICFENTKDVSGYITEKILDCFKAQIVPIYKGAPDVSNYIPDSCFINYDDFTDLNELYLYLCNMSYGKYEKYIMCAKEFMKNGEEQYFGIGNYVLNLQSFVESCKKKRKFSVGIIKIINLYRINQKAKRGQ